MDKKLTKTNILFLAILRREVFIVGCKLESVEKSKNCDLKKIVSIVSIAFIF